MPRKGQAREAKCPKCLDVIREMIPWRESINTRGWRGLLKSDICFFVIMLHKQLQLKQKMHYIRISHVCLLFFSTVYDKPLVNRAYVPNYQYLYQIKRIFYKNAEYLWWAKFLNQVRRVTCKKQVTLDGKQFCAIK